jgi:lysozyme family protein
VKNNFDQCLALVLKSEGGFVNNPRDPGGMTNLGVTKATWEAWVGHTVTESEMRGLGPQDVAPLYKAQYWDKINGDALPYGVDYAVFDFCVNSGVNRAAKVLQQVCGVTQDGKIGAATIAACGNGNAREIATTVCEKRLAFLQSLSTYDTFGKGWANRVASVEQAAFSMAG